MDLFRERFVNLVIALVNVFLLLFHSGAVPADAKQIDLSDMKLVFADEFDGDALNPAVWGPHNGYGVRKGGYWSAGQARVQDGNLIITTQYLENGEFGPGWYTCALDTAGRFESTYGYYECRCILPKGEGLWSAFWMINPTVGTVTDNAEGGAEIDIMESPFWYMGGKESWRVTQNLHYSGYSLQTKYHNVGIFSLDNDPYENYNTYGLLWTPDAYVFYINGREVARTSWGGVSKQPEYMILSCEVDGGLGQPTFGWSGNIENNDKATFAAEFKVDYVRVYQAAQ
ncbi:MAG: glycoside hydrolase family 16 protein [Clostridia bacterium]|nr:glycoside hydrolase family 16 protein [Clostridia bacterium]